LGERFLVVVDTQRLGLLPKNLVVNEPLGDRLAVTPIRGRRDLTPPIRVLLLLALVDLHERGVRDLHVAHLGDGTGRNGSQRAPLVAVLGFDLVEVGGLFRLGRIGAGRSQAKRTHEKKNETSHGTPGIAPPGRKPSMGRYAPRSRTGLREAGSWRFGNGADFKH